MELEQGQEQQQQQLPQQQEQEYRPCIQDGEQRVLDNSLQGAELMSIDQCETIQEMDDSQLVGAPTTVTPDADLAVKEDVSMVDVEVRKEAKAAETSTGKRRRGRPPRIQGKTAPPPPPQRKKKDEEDVCFICFDGGSLVLCDRRGCPKAYHPACIKRDESFFRSKAKWNCGWHICSSCQKACHYMCYTCTYSLCKGCTKDADYVCVRANKGFCGTCMRTVMLIENIALGIKETVQVDFDDKTSWEYLFKVYWIYLKEKLSLTLDELTKAKNPWKGEELPKSKNSWKGGGAMAPKGESSGELCHANDGKGSCLDNYCGNLEVNHSKRRKTKNEPKIFTEENSLVMEKSGVDKVTALPEGAPWATKELMEFVAHMKNGDISVLSYFDVQALLLEYIKRNNLRDPSRKCQIVCDSRLRNLFGKTCVGHIEMLKLLEDHFPVKEKSPADDAARVGVSDTVGSEVETARNSDSQLTIGNDRRRKTRKKADEKGPQINPNPDAYAAIDIHNINLLFLKRSLMENLMDDAEKFHEKVVGSFVRIRIPGGDQKQDMYRLVQVVGTSKVAESYQVGTRTTDVVLEILNLDKKEVVSIDVISNQEFSKDECRRLRQSIKCGLIKRLTVGEIQEKVMAFQAVRVSDRLEAEILRLNHLRDRASEKGHRKEHRECLEKLELLKSPDEQQRRLLEIPNIHTDPNMDPSYESEADDGGSDGKKQGGHVRPRNTGVARKGAELNSMLRGGDVSNDKGNKLQKNSATTCEQSRNVCAIFYLDRDGAAQVHERVSESTWSQGGEVSGLNSQKTPKNLVGSNGSVTRDWDSLAMVQSESLSGTASPVLPPLSRGREVSVNDIETDKLWHYQDPSGKIQGPFSMNQLRKWSTSGLFPFDLRVWRIDEKHDDSILLTDAMVGQFHKKSLLPHTSYLVPQEVTAASKDTDKQLECGLIQNTDASIVDGKKVDHSWKSVQNDGSAHCNGNDELVRGNEWSSHSSSWTTAVDVAVAGDGQTQSSLQGCDLSKGGKSWSDQPQVCNSLPSPSSSGKLCETTPLKVREGHGDENLSSSPNNVNENPLKTSEGPTRIGESDDKQADSEGCSNQSSGQNWRPPPTKSSSSGWDSNSGFVSAAKSVETSEKNQVIDFSGLPNPMPKQSHEDLKGLAAENKQSVSSNVPVPDSGPSWSTASSLVVGGAQLPEVAGEWGGYSSTPAKPSVEEWDSNLVSVSSLKPTEGASDHMATPTSESGQLTHSSPTEPAIDTSIWQPLVPEANEFCSLVDESVSDLLAEVEAMESLGGLPSPTSKMRCEELTQDSDNDCFSPVEGFSPAPDPGKSDALSSTGDIQIPCQLTVANEPLKTCHNPSQQTVTDKPLGTTQMPSQLTVIDEPLGVSQMPSHSTVTEEPLGLSHADILNPQKSFSGHSSTSAEVDGDTKPSDVSVNQWEAGSERQLPASSTVNQGGPGLDIQPPMPTTVSQWEAGSDTHHPALSTTDTSRGTVKRNVNMRREVVAQGNTNMVWGTGHVSVQQHAGTNSATSLENPGSWGSQPRHGGDRFSGPRDHRNYFQGRDSGFGRDRSSWNKQPLYGVGNGGGSCRPPPKGQRVCKFYESGYCKKGASCSYWHP